MSYLTPTGACCSSCAKSSGHCSSCTCPSCAARSATGAAAPGGASGLFYVVAGLGLYGLYRVMKRR